MILLLLLQALPLSAAEPVWRTAQPGYVYSFPRDHFAHPDFRTEWWYYTGNLKTADGHPYGFELVFFRQGQRQPGSAARNPSSWRADDLYLAHLALTDISAGSFRNFRRVNRAGPGLAGADPTTSRVWNGNWEAAGDPDSGQTLTAVADGVRFTLRTRPLKPRVIHGEGGISRKSAAEGRASHYVSFTRLAVDGMLNGSAASGAAWMDHEWFTGMLSAGQVGWDWFSVQLSSGVELMLFQLRRADGSIDAFSAGTYVDAAGRSRFLRRDDFTLTPLEYWSSPRTGGRYPVRWRVRVPSLGVTLECAAAVRDQEFPSEDASGTTYWEGAVTYSGSSAGAGYLEMTGYAGAVALDR